jgi:sugar porter (SP) family MFS transporter
MNPAQTSLQAEHGSLKYVLLPAAVAALGGLLFGFDTAVINGAIVFLKLQFALTDSQTEIAASSLLLGCVFGAGLVAFSIDRFGRKKLLLVAAALFTLSSIGTALPRNFTEFVVARVVGGFAIGLASALSPLYIAEISPARIRGLLVCVNQLALVSGILASYSVNYALSGAGPSNWRWMFASAAVPSALFLFALLTVPESPRWLVQNNREPEAEHFLARINGRDAAHTDILAIRSAVAEESGNILDPTFRRPLVVAILIALFSQFTGINTIIYYGSLVFLEHVRQQTASTALLANVSVGAINFLATIVGMYLIDRVGRKAADDLFFRRHGVVPGRCGGGDPNASIGLRGSGVCSDLCRLLRGRYWHRNLGADVRDQPHPGARARHVNLDRLLVVRNSHRHLYFSHAGSGTNCAWCISGIRVRLCGGGAVCLAGRSRN